MAFKRASRIGGSGRAAAASRRERQTTMTLQRGALRDALEDAGASPDKARAAADEVAGYRSPRVSVETGLTILIVLVSGLYAISGTLLGQVFRLSAQVSSLSVQVSAIGAHLSAIAAKVGA
jgi:hypothetical protein